MMQTPVEGELFVTVVEGVVLPLPPASQRVEVVLSLPRRLLAPFPTMLRIPLFNLTEPLFVTSLLH